MRLLALAGSLSLTLACLLALGVMVLVCYLHPGVTMTWLALPLTGVGLNLLAAMASNQSFRRQRGLLLFHLGLLAIIILAAVGLMTSLDARVEITEGQAFETGNLVIIHKGPWHRINLDQVRFTQGSIRVDYASALHRKGMESRVWLENGTDRAEPRAIDERQPLKLAGYRFSPTSNKGYSVILSWLDDTGVLTTGAVNMPSYPLYEWKQRNKWNTPRGQHLGLELRINEDRTIGGDQPWTLNSGEQAARLVISHNGQAWNLVPGDTAHLEQGRLRFEGIRVWMGYRIDSNPALSWMLLAALLAITGLGFHFWQKFSQLSNTNSTREQALGLSVHA